MNHKNWNDLIKILNGENISPMLMGFIVASPWIPGWFGVSTLDYYSNDDIWFDANLEAINKFPEVIFFPGFWAEYGMTTEPSAFGSKLIWAKKNFPHAGKVLNDISDVDNLSKPNVKTDGLLPFVINRYTLLEEKINKHGHLIKFAVSRGPLNIATFLVGTTELLTAFKLNPEKAHKLINLISEFIIDWLTLQMENFKTIDGIFLLDDIIGFVGEEDFKNFVLPYFKKIYQYFDVSVKFLHNDAHGLIAAKYLNEIGVNLFNFTFEHSINEIKDITDNRVVLMGNIPPRDILAKGSIEEIIKTVKITIDEIKSKKKIIFSCGGAMPPGVSTEQIRTFINTVESHNK